MPGKRGTFSGDLTVAGPGAWEKDELVLENAALHCIPTHGSTTVGRSHAAKRRRSGAHLGSFVSASTPKSSVMWAWQPWQPQQVLNCTPPFFRTITIGDVTAALSSAWATGINL